MNDLESFRDEANKWKVVNDFVREVVVSRYDGATIVEDDPASFAINGRPMNVGLRADMAWTIGDISASGSERFDPSSPDEVVDAINRQLAKPQRPDWRNHYASTQYALKTARRDNQAMDTLINIIRTTLPGADVTINDNSLHSYIAGNQVAFCVIKGDRVDMCMS